MCLLCERAGVLGWRAAEAPHMGPPQHCPPCLFARHLFQPAPWHAHFSPPFIPRTTSGEEEVGEEVEEELEEDVEEEVEEEVGPEPWHQGSGGRWRRW